MIRITKKTKSEFASIMEEKMQGIGCGKLQFLNDHKEDPILIFLNSKGLSGFIILLTFCLLPIQLEAQDQMVNVDSISSSKSHGFLIFPLLQYSPETRAGVGISIVTYFRTSKKDTLYRPSVIHPFMGYTQNKQIFIESPFQLFFDKEKYYLYGLVSFFRYPYKFFGIGNNIPLDYSETYLSQYYSMTINVVKKIAPVVYAGVKIQTGIYSIKSIESQGLLYRNQISGIVGGVNNGIGLLVLYDTRDNIFSSSKGEYIEFSNVFNSPVFLSRYTYNSFIADARKFYRFYKKNIFAAQAYLNINAGNIPFYNLALLGGTKRMRGYYEGRYRDKNYLTFQLEYRSPFLFNRVGAAVFTAYGMVFDNIAGIQTSYIKPSYGAGIRIRFNRKELIHLRFDVAKGYHSVGYYVTLSEAF
jgi:hypothetical protein